MPIIFKGVNEGEEPMDLVATHQRCLIGSVMRTTGPILELGVGWYSTPILHEIAKMQRRLLITADNNWDWLGQFKGLESRWHKIIHVGWWGELFDGSLLHHIPQELGLVFVDQGQPIEREYAIRGLMYKTDVFVMHDTEEKFAYGYGRTLPMFKYKYTDKCQKSWTTVGSNKVDVSNWFLDLPHVTPTQEIT